MAVCAIQPILDDAACLAAVPQGWWDVLELQILCNLRTYLETGETVATCDVQELMDDAVCFDQLTAGQRAVVRLQLLCDISTLLGAGGGAEACTVFAFRHTGDFADPNGNVTGCPGEVYVRSSTGTLWKKLTGENTNTGWAL